METRGVSCEVGQFYYCLDDGPDGLTVCNGDEGCFLLGRADLILIV
jgi:hypothetical protein